MPRPSKLRRSLERGGPLGIALALGIVLVASSALSYRDVRLTAGIVAERQGIGLLHRVEALLGPRDRTEARERALRVALEAHRALGLTYVGVFERDAAGLPRTLLAESGVPLLADSFPRFGAPVFGHDRVRMISGGPRPPPPPEARARDRRPEHRPAPEVDRPFGPPSPFDPPPPPAELVTPDPPPRPAIVIEFEPIASSEAVRRALAALLLASGAAGLLTAAAVVLAVRAGRAERTDAELAAQRHLAQLGEMSAVLAHEIRNPLAALKGHAQLLAERVGPSLAGRVERVVAEAVRLEKLTNDLLEFARSGAINVASADPRALVDEAVAATEPARVEVTTRDAPDVWPLYGARMRQVLVNLIENALGATAPPEKVEVTVAVIEGALAFTVRDRGPGVPLPERARVFEPFHTTKTRGTGLGLAVSQRIVALHGGRIEIDDADGGGAVFRVYVPAQDF